MILHKVEKLLCLLPFDSLSMLTGKLLGDADLAIQEKRRPRFRFSHTIYDKEWCFYCYEKLSRHIKLSPPKYRKVIDSRTRKGFTEQYYVQSATSEVIDLLKDIWYPHQQKIVPFDLLIHVFTPLCLAWWYQDDGHLKIENGQVKKVIIATNSFSTDENKKLIKLIEQRYNLKFSLDKQNRLILYDKPQIFYFIRLIKPYTHESMKRKIQLPVISKGTSAKRTTVYLPRSIPIQHPTKDIHTLLNRLPMLNDQLHEPNMYQSLFITYFQKLKMDKANYKAYQIQLTSEQIHWLHECQNVTGFTMSQIVHLCAIHNT
jgi:LAGLIDADG DNA endonuclease family